jgi:cytochrome b561
MANVIAEGAAEPGPVDPAPRYSRTAAVLHWLIAGAILTNLPLGLLSARFESTFESAIINVHKVLGIVVLGLSLVRLAWRLGHRPPPISFDHKFEEWAARAVHGSLYLLMIALPTTGWLVTSSFPGRHPIRLGPVDIPFLPVTPEMANAIAAHQAHSILAAMMALLVTGHVLAALRHQFLLKDGLFGRMSVTSS